VPSQWLARVRHTLASLGPRVQASRMVREYVETQYTPAATAVGLATADGFQLAKDLAAYRARLSGAWPHIRITDCGLAVDDGHTPVVGERVRVVARVDLAGLDQSDVEVQGVVGRVGDTDELTDVATATMTPDEDGRWSGEVTLPHTGSLGVTARVLPRHDLLASPAELNRVVLA
jgi:glycogen phosphorylase